MYWNPDGIVHLYDVVLHQERNSSMDVTGEQWESQIRNSLEQIANAHNPRTQSLLSSSRVSVDYNLKSVRCAYVHRFASLYTGLAYEMLSSALRQNQDLCKILYPKLTYLQLCCLGGGPGTDLVGVWTALYHYFGNFYGSVTVVDKMFGWEDTVSSVIKELQTGCYPVSPAFDPLRFDWSFLTADLLGDMSKGVQNTIRSADMVTMFKFLSAAACEDTEKMLEKIFNVMKPGALVFFINNASGGFHELVNRVAEKCRFITIVGPLCHVVYYNEAFNVFRFGNESLWKTTVTVQILQKPKV